MFKFQPQHGTYAGSAAMPMTAGRRFFVLLLPAGKAAPRYQLYFMSRHLCADSPSSITAAGIADGLAALAKLAIIYIHAILHCFY